MLKYSIKHLQVLIFVCYYICMCVLEENCETDLLKSINHAITATNVLEVCSVRPVSSDSLYTVEQITGSAYRLLVE